MDNFEWERGYVERFGVVFNDFAFGTDENTAVNQTHQPTADGQERTPKDSACWLSQVWQTNQLLDPSYEC